LDIPEEFLEVWGAEDKLKMLKNYLWFGFAANVEFTIDSQWQRALSGQCSMRTVVWSVIDYLNLSYRDPMKMDDGEYRMAVILIVPRPLSSS